MTTISREFQIFAKPVGPICNLNCSYCYYLDKQNLYPDTGHFLMTDDILEKYIVKQIQASPESMINFSWHGGEPFLAGIDFFKKVRRLQSVHIPAGKTIVNGIQTNGTLTNDEWCRFLSEEGFIIGISIDGPAELHNIYRRTKDDSTTCEKVIRGFQLLKKHAIVPEILCVVMMRMSNILLLSTTFSNNWEQDILHLSLLSNLNQVHLQGLAENQFLLKNSDYS